MKLGSKKKKKKKSGEKLFAPSIGKSANISHSGNFSASKSGNFTGSYSQEDFENSVSKSLTSLANLPLPMPQKKVTKWDDDGGIDDDWNLDDVHLEDKNKKPSPEKPVM
jgi:hypothetical protein